MIALLLSLALLWPTGAASPAAESYLLEQAQAYHPGPNLVFYPPLDREANWRAKSLAEAGVLTHDIGGKRFWDFFGQFGVKGSVWSCEIAAYMPAWVDEQGGLAWGAWDAWLGSPGHRACIVDPRYDAIGIGSFKAANGDAYFVILYSDQPERIVTAPLGRWLRSTPGGDRVALLPAGTRLVVFGHKRDAFGRVWDRVHARGQWGWVPAVGTRGMP